MALWAFPPRPGCAAFGLPATTAGRRFDLRPIPQLHQGPCLVFTRRGTASCATINCAARAQASCQTIIRTPRPGSACTPRPGSAFDGVSFGSYCYSSLGFIISYGLKPSPEQLRDGRHWSLDVADVHDQSGDGAPESVNFDCSAVVFFKSSKSLRVGRSAPPAGRPRGQDAPPVGPRALAC